MKVTSHMPNSLLNIFLTEKYIHCIPMEWLKFYIKFVGAANLCKIPTSIILVHFTFNGFCSMISNCDIFEIIKKNVCRIMELLSNVN